MSAEVMKAKTPDVVPVSWTRIASLRLNASINFLGTENDFIPCTAANRVAAFAARLEADGSVVRISANQRADGLALERPYVDRADGQTKCERAFVPWSNLKSVAY